MTRTNKHSDLTDACNWRTRFHDASVVDRELTQFRKRTKQWRLLGELLPLFCRRNLSTTIRTVQCAGTLRTVVDIAQCEIASEVGSHSEHRFPAPSSKKGCRKPLLEVWGWLCIRLKFNRRHFQFSAARRTHTGSLGTVCKGSTGPETS